MSADYDEITAVFTALSELSNKYYELIPKKVAEETIVRPFS